MKIKIQIKHWLNGSVLFEYKSENNTIAKTVSEAIKQNANLSSADLRYANLSSADLSYANLSYADLRYAKNSKLAIAMTRILPEGELIGWKKCRDDVIVKLLIPKEAKRSHAFGRKCRAEYAEVLGLYNAKGKKVAYSTQDATFEYRKGATVKPTKPFSDNWLEECESGIHFFITREEAEAYQ